MKILSFDIGIINMAYCIMEDTTKNILHWEVFSLCNSTEIENCKDLVRKLDDRPHILEDIGIVLLERQPKCNPKMRAMASSLRSYLIVRGFIDKGQKFTLKDYSPKHKLMCWDGPVPKINDKSEYRRRKKLAIYQCEQLIKDQSQNVQDIYNDSQKKKDDLSDCYLQCLSYILFKSDKKDQRITKRKPTLRQLKYSKLSKSNIKYIIDEFINKFETVPIDSQSDVLTLSNVLDMFFVRNKKVKTIIDKVYGTEVDVFIKELVPDAFKSCHFKLKGIPLDNTKQKTQKKVKDKEEELEENSD